MAIDGGWTEQEFAAFYRGWSNAEQRYTGYTRERLIEQNRAGGKPTAYEQRWGVVVQEFGLDPADRVLIVGAGFGWGVEAAHDAGYPNVWGIDSSPYVEANKGTEARGDVVLVSDDIRGGGRVRAALRSATGDDVFDFIVTEDVVSCYPDSELTQMLPLLETLLETGAPAGNIIHLVTMGEPGTMDSQLNAKLPAEWVAMAPTHSWVNLRGLEVV